MKVYTLQKPELEELVQEWKKEGKVYRPDDSAGEAGTPPGWREIDDPGPLEIPCGPGRSSIKTFYFPQPETLATFSLKAGTPDKDLLQEPARLTERRVLLGVRPCDARSVVLNSLPYAEDPFFQANLERTCLVGLACSDTLSTCFCETMGGSPLDNTGLDIALFKKDGHYLAEVVTDKGASLLAGAKLNEADEAQVRELADSRAHLQDQAQSLLDRLKGQELDALYQAPFWQALGESCLNCGACTFMCPTCYCFDVQDEVVRGKGRRIRYWDSCMFPLYTLHTTGHNPRGQKMQRVRNRFLHKLKYFPDRFGPFSCVGCGRCIQECPVNIDIREVLADLQAVE